MGPVALMVLDLNMPDMHGLEVLKFVRGHAAFRHAPGDRADHARRRHQPGRGAGRRRLRST